MNRRVRNEAAKKSVHIIQQCAAVTRLLFCLWARRNIKQPILVNGVGVQPIRNVAAFFCQARQLYDTNAGGDRFQMPCNVGGMFVARLIAIGDDKHRAAGKPFIQHGPPFSRAHRICCRNKAQGGEAIQSFSPSGIKTGVSAAALVSSGSRYGRIETPRFRL